MLGVVGQQYCWFSVSRHPKEIKIKTIGQMKSRVWEMKGGRYTKTLAKIWVEGITGIRDIRGNVLPMLELIRMSSNMADGNQQKHLLPSFDTKA